MTIATKAQVKAAAKTRIPRASETTPVKPNQTRHSPTHSVNGASFQASDWLPGDLFTASSKVPYVSEVEYSERLEKIAGQRRSVRLLTENLHLSKELHSAEGVAIQGQIEQVKNLTFAEKLATQQVRLQQAQTTTQIEQARLQGLHINLNGETDSLPLHQESWSLKLEGLRVDIEHARRLLTEKRSQLPQAIDVVAH